MDVQENLKEWFAEVLRQRMELIELMPRGPWIGAVHTSEELEEWRRIMGKPRTVTSENWYDIFSSWPAEDRAVALKVLEQTHRQLVKLENRAAPEDKP